MESDRELLELAAKAAGIEIDKSEVNGGGRGNTGFDILGNAVLNWHNGETWNPLADDGDALRLAVKLRMVIDVSTGTDAQAQYPIGRAYHFIDEDGSYGDESIEEITRRAIVRAAAEIGRAM